MAIAGPHYRCLETLFVSRLLPQGKPILEIGEANWYGDIPPPKEVTRDTDATDPYAVAKDVYAGLFGTRDVTSIDLHGTPAALPLDLNEPIHLSPGSFGTVFNHGTAEHIFNVGNIFRVMHDHCVDGGLMVHESPFTGWIDHGFYTLQPTLYFDVAKANGYEVVFMAVTHIELQMVAQITSREQLLALAPSLPPNCMIFCAMRKTSEAPFRVPMQGVYAGTVSAEAQRAWRTLR